MSGMCYYPLTTRQRELYLAHNRKGKEGGRRGGKGNLSCRNESLASSFAFVAFPPTHTHVRGKEDSSSPSFVESRRLNLPPRCQKKIGRGSWLLGKAVKVWRQRGRFLPSLSSLWPRTFARITIACRQTTAAAAAAAFQFNPPLLAFSFCRGAERKICQAVCPVFPPSFALPLVTRPCAKV